MTEDFNWAAGLPGDITFGFLDSHPHARKLHNPQMVLNGDGTSVLRTLRDELKRSDGFVFSVAFVTARAIALLKQEFVEFEGRGFLITSDYLGFNSPEAFAELLNLKQFGIEVRIHSAGAFHPKGYIFEQPEIVTAMIGSSNLTESALAKNHEWNLKVSAASGSDLVSQINRLVEQQFANSRLLTAEWISNYAASYSAPMRSSRHTTQGEAQAGPQGAVTGLEPRTTADPPEITTPLAAAILPNSMQSDALEAIRRSRLEGHKRGLIISATGTGKTILSALDVRSYAPSRMLFVAHREQILDRTIEEFQRVLGGSETDYGKLTGTAKQSTQKYVFATVQTLSKPETLQAFDPSAFDYVVVDEVHRAGAASYKRLIEYFKPDFLMGMTATPERNDSENVFELFDYNVLYEIRLQHALEAEMLSPFHYYGIAEVIDTDGMPIEGHEVMGRLVSQERVDYIVDAITKYGQAGLAPRGLIFCARRDEAAALSHALNRRSLRGKLLRTVALTGEDNSLEREHAVRRLESGEIDYILTVDIFNEGIDIPSVNQIVMLRQTKSAIVFVQQLGRGLRKADGKEYLVVIDFIGNYANNYMIPIALFGDESLNKESLRKNLLSAEETGVLAGLSSVRFDRIAQERVLQSIAQAALDGMRMIKAAVESMSERVGGVPKLSDFERFESVDPVLLATKKEHYPALLNSTLKIPVELTKAESAALSLLSNEVFASKRVHEFILLEMLLNSGWTTWGEFEERLAGQHVDHSKRVIRSVVQTFSLETHTDAAWKRYGHGIAHADDVGQIVLDAGVWDSYQKGGRFSQEVDDLLSTGLRLAVERFDEKSVFTVGRQYSRSDSTQLVGWPRKWASTIYGYKADRNYGVCPIFVTLHKSDSISASTAYEDELVDRTHMHWYSKSRRTLQSPDVLPIVSNDVSLFVFVQKDDADGDDFFFLGEARSGNAVQTTMPGDGGKELNVVHMDLTFSQPIDSALFDYFSPTISD